ncbi:MAG: EF-hand domain-containing protein [Thermoguttaceae bacterium]|jgi:hypothetical protein
MNDSWAARWGLVALGMSALAVWGCGRAPSRVSPLGIAPDAARKALELYDADGDGFLEGAELDKVPGLKAALRQVDADHDGKISAEEIDARIASWRQSQVGRITVACKVTRRGIPLRGATVTFVPESFLGDELKTAGGTTDQFGTTTLSTAEPEALPGVSPGFYRVRITKSGDAIPARYNTDTVLGQEAAVDAQGIQAAVKFDLDY